MNTKVGNDFVRGVSGGERKRVTIAEAALAGAPLQCWDNSTRGLDSANAVEFCRTLRMSSELVNTTSCVAIYQSPQSAYEIFDKVLVLYEGRQIFFGKTHQAAEYFIKMGFECPSRQPTPDFLTSMTSPQERLVRPEFEGRTPRTPDEFAERWKRSPERARLVAEIEAYEHAHRLNGKDLEKFKASRKAQQSKRQRIKSPFTLSYGQQTMLCLKRGFWRLKAGPSLTITQLFSNVVMSLIIASIFYNLSPTTSSFFQRGSLLYLAIIVNALSNVLEILTLYSQRPIVEKQSRYAFYHPSCEAIASMLTDFPNKLLTAVFQNLPLYFLSNLRRTPGHFFFFLLINFTLTLVMSSLYRTLGALTRSLASALVPTAVITLGLIIYTGFALPIPYIHGWAIWIRYINPVAFGFEALMINEFAGREFECSQYVPAGPGYDNVAPAQHICTPVGSKLGSAVVQGTDYLEQSFSYDPVHKWRNFGILLVFLVGLTLTYLIASEYITEKRSKGEVLVFRRGHAPTSVKHKIEGDIESGKEIPSRNGLARLKTDASAVIQEQTAIFHWKNVSYDIKVKGEPRRILDRVDGWIKPGTLTALMGVSGAGKTTLLDGLAQRLTMGVISGDVMADGRQRDASFQRKTGYAQQRDLHLSTSTVREALNFSALLRQPASIPRKEKLAYVDEVIKLLDMEEYADAVVGVPGEGLNVEQRKRLTIGVELAARPQLLLFLDEPTSGLDSQTSWAICDLMEKLAKHGTAILCTIHQPSAMLFQRFDRLLLLASDGKSSGKTVYFGQIGENSSTMIEYFERHGAQPCPSNANPAEWMLEVIGAAPGSNSETDWQVVWRESPEFAQVHRELDEMATELPQVTKPAIDTNDKTSYREFAAPFAIQQYEVLKRVAEQYWRTPSYIYSKTSLCLFSTIFIGFSFFLEGTSLQALQNQLFSTFMIFFLFGNLSQQIMPLFVTQRALFEVRERPAKTFSWKAFMLANIFIEIPWQTLMSVIVFFTYYYSVGLEHNASATNTVHERGVLFFLFVWVFMLFTSSFAHLMISAIPDAETASNIGNSLFSLSLIFCGVLAAPSTLPGFWIFMYRVSPFAYLVSGMLSSGLAETAVVCAPNELLPLNPPPGQTCQQYMAPYISAFGGYLTSDTLNSTTACSFCSAADTDTYLSALGIEYSQRWRNWGLLWVYVGFNVLGALSLYWLFRVPNKKLWQKRKRQGDNQGAAAAVATADLGGGGQHVEKF